MRMQSLALFLLFLLIASRGAFGQEPPSTPDPVPAMASPSEETLVKAPGSLSREQIQAMIRQVAEKDMENDKRQRDYTYVERVVEHKLKGNGEVGSTETRTYDVLEIYNEPVRRLTSKDDKPLSAKEVEKEDEKIQKIIDKRKNESEGDREKRLKREEREREDARRFVTAVADAYDFQLVGTESLDGRETYVIDAEPRPGFEARSKEAKFLPKFKFRVWIDRAENQWVKLDAECIDTVSVGLFLARVHKGSRILIDTTRVNDEVWLPRHVALHVDVRVALLKNFNVEQDVTYADYKKFHSASRIVGMEEVK